MHFVVQFWMHILGIAMQDLVGDGLHVMTSTIEFLGFGGMNVRVVYCLSYRVNISSGILWPFHGVHHAPGERRRLQGERFQW